MGDKHFMVPKITKIGKSIIDKIVAHRRSLVLLLFILVVVTVWPYILPTISMDWFELKNTADARNLALTIFGLIGFPLLVMRTYLADKQVKLTEKSQHIDLYQKGAAMLGDARLSVRQAGVLALKQLAETDPEGYYKSVVTVLCSFIRDRSDEQHRAFKKAQFTAHQEATEKDACDGDDIEQDSGINEKEEFLEPIAPDNQTAISTLTEMRSNGAISGKFRDLRFDLRGSNLRGAVLSRADLSGTDLSGADLSEAVLIDADLSDADLRESVLHKAVLRRADLRRAFLLKADLSDTVLHKADLSWAYLRYADLRRAFLHEAVLINVDLSDADLSGAHLHEADLNGANLREADLNGANLHEADLSDAELHEADLSGAYLHEADLRKLYDAYAVNKEGERIIENWLQKTLMPTKSLEKAILPDDWVVTGGNKKGWTISLSEDVSADQTPK